MNGTDRGLMVFEAAKFINDHPAFAGYRHDGESSLSVGRWKVCQNGVSLEPGNNPSIFLYEGNERYDEFKGKGFREEDGEIWVDYRSFYGYDWEYDHVETWLEGGCCEFRKVDNLHRSWALFKINEDDWFDDWYHDYKLDVSAYSYDEALLLFAEQVKIHYGDWSIEFEAANSIVPSWINRFNCGKDFLKRGLRDLLDEFTDDEKENDTARSFTIERNPEYLRLEDYHLNALWWFRHRGKDIGLGANQLMDMKTGLEFMGISV